MDSNQSGAVGGTILIPFHLSRESLKPLKWPERPDIAKIKPGFVEFGLGCSWRVHEPLQYLSFDNIQTLGQLGSEINVRYVRRERICLFCSTDPVGGKNFTLQAVGNFMFQSLNMCDISISICCS